MGELSLRTENTIFMGKNTNPQFAIEIIFQIAHIRENILFIEISRYPLNSLLIAY